MVIRLHGSIERLTPTGMELNVGGVVYYLDIPLPTSIAVRQSPAWPSVTVEVAECVRDGNVSLYGFHAARERAVFMCLMKINGVGARIALSILSAYPVGSLVSIIERRDTKALTGVKGVGQKMAAKIILELSGSSAMRNVLSSCTDDPLHPASVGATGGSADAGLDRGPKHTSAPDLMLVREALENLGYKDSEINNAICRLDDPTLALDASEIVRAILRSFGS